MHTLKSFRMLGGWILVTAAEIGGHSSEYRALWQTEGQGKGSVGGAGHVTMTTMTHMAVMVSLWKVTKAMPRGFSFTFFFSLL